MKKLTVAFLLTFLLSACGGGGDSATPVVPEPETPSTPVPVTSVPATVTLKAPLVRLKSITGKGVTRPEVDYGDASTGGIDGSIGLVGYDDLGAEFTIQLSYTIEDQTYTVDQALRPTGAMWLNDDLVYIEFFVRTNGGLAIEAWQYLFKPSTGQLAKVQTLDVLSEAFETHMRSYVLPANSPHNGTDQPIVYLKNVGWTKLSVNWSTLDVSKTPVLNWVDTRGSLDGASFVLFAEDGTIYRMMQVGGGRYLYFGKTQLTSLTDYAIFWQEDGRNYFYDDKKLWELVNGEMVFLANDDRDIRTARRMTEVLKTNDGELYTIECGIHAINGTAFETTLEPNGKVDGWVAGNRMLCSKTNRRHNPPPIGNRDTNPLYADEYCGHEQSWELYDVNTETQVVRAAVALMGEPQAVVSLNDDEVYVMQLVCKETGGDGITEAAWSLVYTHTIVDLATGLTEKVPQTVAFSTVK